MCTIVRDRTHFELKILLERVIVTEIILCYEKPGHSAPRHIVIADPIQIFLSRHDMRVRANLAAVNDELWHLPSSRTGISILPFPTAHQAERWLQFKTSKILSMNWKT